MDKKYNIFISHYGKDDRHVQSLKQRFKDQGYNIRNSSIDSTKHKHRTKIPSDRVVSRLLRKGISWAGTFICLIGEKTHERKWVNHEIRQAHLQGKTIVGIYKHGCKDNVQLPDAYKKYGGAILGWNSLDKLGDAMVGKDINLENPDGSPKAPTYTVTRVKC